MRLLIIKMSSMGDVLHTLPAVTDAFKANPNLTIDWIVEEAFQEIPRWHPKINQVFPIALRRWRKRWWQPSVWRQWRAFRQQLRQQSYDMIIDAQGLLKSAWLMSCLKAPQKVGLNWRSAREALASVFYTKRIAINPSQHAITRTRQLFAKALHYDLHLDAAIDYGIDRGRLVTAERQSSKPYLVFLHGTTWPTKHWPETYWQELAKLASNAGFTVRLPWGNTPEKQRALRIAKTSGAHVLPKLSLQQVAMEIAGAHAVVAVDTGLGHLTAALGVPCLSLYGPTNPDLTGALGPKQAHLRMTFPCAPCLQKQCSYQGQTNVKPACFSTYSPQQVWDYVQTNLRAVDS